MAPSHSRQLLAWTFPTIAVLLSYLWFKRRRIGAPSDPGGGLTDNTTPCKPPARREDDATKTTDNTIVEEEKTFSRSLSGVDSAPIDIIFPPELRSSKVSPKIVSDDELDLEIERIRSMKNDSFVKTTRTRSLPEESKTPPEKSTTPVTVVAEEDKVVVRSPIESEEVVVASKVVASVEIEEVAMNIKCEEEKKKEEEAAVVPKKEEKEEPQQQQQQTKAKTPKKGKKAKRTAVQQQQQQQQRHNNHNNNDDELHNRQSSERDSANHSPADFMLASLSLSSISDNHSEGSNDSGKGGSDVATPPSRTPAGDGSVAGDHPLLGGLPSVYEFVIPQTLVGRLIGRHGSFVTEINEKTRSHIFIKKHPTSGKMKVCAVEGTQVEIDGALQMIRNKFPLKRYPEVTLEQVAFLPQVNTVPLTADHLYLKLIEGINNDTIVSCMVTPGHLFLQQPTHPTYPNLNLLTDYMYRCYSELDSPLLPNPIPENTVCVAHSVGVWYRAMILSSDKETDVSYVKFLDYGGYAYVENSKLRQIRGDFLLLPFQAAECVLANIGPAGGDDAPWPDEAYDHVAEMTKGAIVYTQIINYTEEGVPLVLCYVVVGPQYVCLNEELVNRGYAEWRTYETSEEVAEGAVGGAVEIAA